MLPVTAKELANVEEIATIAVVMARFSVELEPALKATLFSVTLVDADVGGWRLCREGDAVAPAPRGWSAYVDHIEGCIAGNVLPPFP